MALIARKPTFELPAEGWQPGTLTRVKDLGCPDWAEGKPMTELTFTLDETDSNGQPFEVTHCYHLTLHEMARLRIDLEAGLDRELADEEDIEALVGTRFGIKVGYRTSSRGGKFSDVKALRPAEGTADSWPAVDSLPF